jgi:hypothetical protein
MEAICFTTGKGSLKEGAEGANKDVVREALGTEARRTESLAGRE